MTTTPPVPGPPSFGCRLRITGPDRGGHEVTVQIGGEVAARLASVAANVTHGSAPESWPHRFDLEMTGTTLVAIVLAYDALEYGDIAFRVQETAGWPFAAAGSREEILGAGEVRDRIDEHSDYHLEVLTWPM